MILPASYLNGFAPRDGEPLYPSLWTGCVGAWNPGLGPTGLTLRDWSGSARPCTLSNMTAAEAWVLSHGRYALNCDGVNDYGNCGTISEIVAASAETTILAWVYRRSSSGGICSYRNAPGSGWATQWTTTGTLRCFTAGAGTESTLNVGTNAWVPVAFVWSQTSITMHMRGAASQTFSITKDAGTGFLSIGGWDSGATAPPDGLFEDIRVYDRRLSTTTINTYFTRRGIAYEMAPRRRLSVQSVVSYSTFRPSVLRGSR